MSTFKPITDYDEADKLWEARLLWWKHKYNDRYELDLSKLENSKPSIAGHYDYAILVEE